jgi:hypothetical protein
MINKGKNEATERQGVRNYIPAGRLDTEEGEAEEAEGEAVVEVGVAGMIWSEAQAVVAAEEDIGANRAAVGLACEVAVDRAAGTPV